MCVHAPGFAKFWLALDETVDWLFKGETDEQTEQSQWLADYATLAAQVWTENSYYQGAFDLNFEKF